MFIMKHMIDKADESVEIAKLSVDEWQAYRQLRLEALQDSPQAYGSTYQEQANRPDSFWQNRLIQAEIGDTDWLLFARYRQQLVGMIGAYRDKTSDPEDGTLAATIVSVYVSPAWRGRGISQLLMDEMLDTLKQKGIQRAHLAVCKDQKAALKLYENSGFILVGIVNNLMGDGLLHDEYLMDKNLDV
jgi:ribosomal protein S18 acetylase RimI-like enzyme